MTYSEAQQTLLRGNQAYVAGNSTHPHSDLSARKRVVDGQSPFAIVLCCSDSRVVPELIFDTGIGDLFVIRVAGNIVDDAVIASIEYAVAHLDTNLVVVLGHETCGAVTAVVNGVAEGHLDALSRSIQPAVETAQRDAAQRDAAQRNAAQQEDVVDQAVRIHAQRMAQQLQQSAPILKPASDENRLKIVPAYYSLADGTVTLI